MKRLLGVGLVYFVICIVHVAEAKGVFYQPQIRDQSYTQQQWNELAKKLKQDGFTFVVLQWSAYGQHDFSSDVIFQRLIVAVKQARLDVWMGLDLPDDYFRVISQNKPSKLSYLQAMFQRHKTQLTSLANAYGDSIVGWYIPSELSNAYLDDVSTRERMYADISALAKQSDLPVAVSYFISAPFEKSQIMRDIKAFSKAGIELWLQRGNGLKNAQDISSVLATLPCSIGIIHEHFYQVSENKEPFKAIKAMPRALSKTVKRCHQSIVFSLRYLPYSRLDF